MLFHCINHSSFKSDSKVVAETLHNLLLIDFDLHLIFHFIETSIIKSLYTDVPHVIGTHSGVFPLPHHLV